ncbi:hypothetical protein BU15DRAFT_77559 [Melanogaster broomeanus]|nr:hypothetical protein BU15DRAFT_77559 [Melanogaster broomeanus]
MCRNTLPLNYILPQDLKTADGEQVFLFSSRHPKTVRRHFHWMALHGVDGAFLQRFAGQCDIEAGNQGIRRIRDEVGHRVKEAAEAEGRVFAIMYDVSGVAPDKIQRVLEQDWIHLLRDQCLLDSPNYLREKGRPVVALWGFGFDNRNHTPDLVRSIANFFRSSTPGGVYLVAGVPGHWRTSTSDADRNPEFVQVWTECFDALSPWTVGRYGNEEDADRWGEERVKADAEYLKQLEEDRGRKVDYIPVVLPGGSGYNLSGGKWGLNGIKRNGGRFLWKQIYNARRAGVRTIYGAMWDEYDEGTAFMPVVSSASQLPAHTSYDFLALDADGYDLPSDWYMRIAGSYRTIGEYGRITWSQTLWRTSRGAEKRQSAPSGHGKQRREVKGAIDEPPPPPYTEEEIHQQGLRHQQEIEAVQVALGSRAEGHSSTVPNHRWIQVAHNLPDHLPWIYLLVHPLSLRPSVTPQHPAEKVEVVMAPPAVPPRRPSSSYSRHATSASVSSLADDFARQGISTHSDAGFTQNMYQPGIATPPRNSPGPANNMPSTANSPLEVGVGQGGWRPPSRSPRPPSSAGVYSSSWNHTQMPGPDGSYSPSYINPHSHSPPPPRQSSRMGAHPPSPPPAGSQDMMSFPGITHYGAPEGGLGWAGGPGPMNYYPVQPTYVSSSYGPQAQSPESHSYYYHNQTTMGGPQPPMMGYAPYGQGYDGSLFAAPSSVAASDDGPGRSAASYPTPCVFSYSH